MKEYIKIDVSNQVLGRISSFIAKRALMGDNIVVVNCRNAVVTGAKQQVFESYVAKNNIKVFSNHVHGPFFPHRPDTFLRHTVHGMLPKNSRGRAALMRVEFYIGEIPERFVTKYQNISPKEYPKASAEQKKCNVVSVNDICIRNGWAAGR